MFASRDRAEFQARVIDGKKTRNKKKKNRGLRERASDDRRAVTVNLPRRSYFRRENPRGTNGRYFGAARTSRQQQNAQLPSSVGPRGMRGGKTLTECSLRTCPTGKRQSGRKRDIGRIFRASVANRLCESARPPAREQVEPSSFAKQQIRREKQHDRSSERFHVQGAPRRINPAKS